MSENDFFEDGKERPPLRIYSILKRERERPSLLRQGQNFSKPRKKNSALVFCSAPARREHR